MADSDVFGEQKLLATVSERMRARKLTRLEYGLYRRWLRLVAGQSIHRQRELERVLVDLHFVVAAAQFREAVRIRPRLALRVEPSTSQFMRGMEVLRDSMRRTMLSLRRIEEQRRARERQRQHFAMLDA